MVRGQPSSRSVSEHRSQLSCGVSRSEQATGIYNAWISCLQSGVSNPWHAIQLSTGHYVVCQDVLPGVVSVVGVDGQVIHSYRQSQTSDVTVQVHGPSSLAVTKNDDILLTDQDNQRIQSINRSTDCVQALALSVDGGIRPEGLCLDESRGRLYVGEWGGQHRVLVFDGVLL